MTPDEPPDWERALEAAKSAASRVHAARQLPSSDPEVRAASADFHTALDQRARAADQVDCDASPIQPDLP
jgi:hypothetical protein